MPAVRQASASPSCRPVATARPGDPRGAALLRFATAVIDYRGDVPDDELAAARRAGLTDAELIEVVAEVSLNTFSNYANRLARPELDFPPVAQHARAAASDLAA